MNELIPLAVEMANEVHWHQVDKAGQPYIWHPLRVSLQFTTPTFQIVALLHDVIEDAPTPRDSAGVQAQIYSRFGVEVGDAVKAITHRKNEYLPDYWARAKANPIAHQVKIADVEDNLYRLSQIPDQATQDRLYVKYTRAMEVLA
jgi:(p)ppGpp synthase/HD superfamily hydrolase